MICVVVYIGGEIQHGPMGAEYSINPRISFSVDGQGFDDVKRAIYDRLGYHKNDYNLKIQARCNVGVGCNRFYQLVPICDDECWQTIYDMTEAAQTQYQILALYIETVANLSRRVDLQSSVDSVVPETQPRPSKTRYRETQAGPSQIQYHKKQPKTTQLTAAMVADLIRVDIKKDVIHSIKYIGGLVRKAYPGVVIKYNMLWSGRELAIAQQFGSWEGSYSILIPQLDAITRSNPGTKYEVLSEPMMREGYRQFKAIAWAYGPCIAAVPHLRPVVSVDASSLSGRYDGMLLMACGYDAENKLLPLAFALVEKESSESWGWFMKWLRIEVISVGRFMCVVSNNHKEIKWVFKQRELGWYEAGGECVHRLCSQHVMENLMHVVPETSLCNIFMVLVKKKKPRRFDEGFELLRQKCPDAIEYLKKVGRYDANDHDEVPKPEKVFQTLDSGYRWEIMTINGSEPLNIVFQQCRRLPVAKLVKDTFYKCNEWFVERRKPKACIAKGHMWSIRVEGLLAKRRRKCGAMTAIPLGQTHGEYEVLVKGEKVPNKEQAGKMSYTYQDFRYKVTVLDEQRVECACLKPQLTGIPCSHVLAVCQLSKMNENTFVHHSYSLTKLVDTYSEFFHPYGGDQHQWPPYTGLTIVPENRLIMTGKRCRDEE